MLVHLYAMCWNDAEMLGFFFRHYDGWVDRYFIYDNGSTDGSLDVLSNHPRVELRPIQQSPIESSAAMRVHSPDEVWKASRGNADWVVVTALDEHVHCHGYEMTEYLRISMQQGVTLIPALGYKMLSNTFPDLDEWLCKTRTWGAPFSHMNKLNVFNPDALLETGYAIGRRVAAPSGILRLPDRDQLMLLHYKFMDFDRTLGRYRRQSTFRASTEIARSWESRYILSAQELRQNWTAFEARSVDVGRPDFQPWETFEAPRWWRSEPRDMRARVSAEAQWHADVEVRDAEIRRLQSVLEEQTNWNLQLRDQVAERDVEIVRLQGLLEDQTKWNLALRDGRPPTV